MKTIKRFFSGLLVACMLCAIPAYKASADSLFNTIMNAGSTLSAYEIEIKHIMDRMTMPTTPSNPTIPVTIPVPVEEQKNNLITFAIQSYIEHGKVHKVSDETIHKKNLPLTVLTWMSGYGRITGVSIDGVEVKSALVAKVPFDNVDMDKRCMEFVTLDESLINSLSNGNHRIIVRCTGPDGSGFVTYSDDFTFNLAD